MHFYGQTKREVERPKPSRATPEETHLTAALLSAQQALNEIASIAYDTATRPARRIDRVVRVLVTTGRTPRG